MTAQPSSSTHEILADLVSAAGPSAIAAVAGALENGQLTLASSSVGISRVRGVDTRNAEVFARAFAELPNVDPTSVALALRTSQRVTLREASRAPQVEVVWTGPDAGGALVRPTAAVLREMLRNCRAGGEIFLVGYSLTADDGSPMKEVIDLLGEASANLAKIKVVLHKDDEAKNRDNLLAAWNVFTIKPTIFTWEPSAAGPYAKVHAKVLVVDRVDVLVTSANFTYHGLHENIEVGLRVRGPQAAAIAQRFDHLIADGVLNVWAD